MNGLKETNLKLVNLDLVKFGDGTEYVHLQGLVPMSEKRKSEKLCGEYEFLEFYDKYEEAWDKLLAECKQVDTITFTGYYMKKDNKLKYKPCSIVGWDYKKGK